MKLIRIFTISVLTIFFLSNNGYTIQFDSAKKPSIYPTYEYFEYNDTQDSWVAVGAILDELGLSVLVENIPGTTNDLRLFYLAGWSDLEPYTYVSALRESAGYPAPGPGYESIEYTFYVDQNANNNRDPGEVMDTFTIPSGSIVNLGFVKNVSITGGNNPTITWDGIDGYNNLYYRVRIFPVDGNGNTDKLDLLFVSELLTPIAGNSFSYTYQGNLFSIYDELSFAIDAADVVDGRIFNRSRYYQKHSIVPWNTDDDGDGYTENQNDCDDTDASINPGAAEICGDGIDQDCNGSDLACTPDPDDTDDDGDGYTENQNDCDDTDASINPGTAEICGDGIDQDCNGSDLACAPDPNDTDDDGDGYTENQNDCNDTDASINPGAAEICGDGIDQDCSGSDLACTPGPNDTDDDGDGYTENQNDCDDTDASINPGAAEICGDGIDQDCDGNDLVCSDDDDDDDDDDTCFISTLL